MYYLFIPKDNGNWEDFFVHKIFLELHSNSVAAFYGVVDIKLKRKHEIAPYSSTSTPWKP